MWDTVSRHYVIFIGIY